MRVKRGVTKRNRHNKVRKAAKGMQGARGRTYRLAKQAIIRSLQYAYRDRRNRKREIRKLWVMRINSACRQHDLTYSQFIAKLKQNNIELNRKSLAELAVREPKAFEDIVKSLK